ncbi:urease accessory protein [Cognatiyoonia koreensis]|uniref:Urease accessory protein UreD n=1 Tax=Cognatiyoonia koreensis TaxID=364200 RepID=A0A1I0QIS7_9RHOB|nr:urease accessory protein UreD [Cognatiyoonia koreensis]SEW26869.1 urease accessory protein [Cognatiyoonia koreensis]
MSGRSVQAETPINIQTDTRVPQSLSPQPRARGDVSVSAKTRNGRTVLDGLRQSGSLKLLFPRVYGPALQGVLINTAGGVTGGDRFNVKVDVPFGAHLTLTTQAAERAYRAQSGETGQVQGRIRVADGGRLDWLPQETIVFDGAAMRRRLDISLSGTARLLMCEPLIFGRAAMGETVRSGRFHDRISIIRDGIPVFCDAIALTGDITAHLAKATIAGGAGAMATLVYVAPDAESHLPTLRDGLGATAGASLLAPDVLVMRVLAPDGFLLRKTLCPILTALSGTTLPRPWMI